MTSNEYCYALGIFATYGGVVQGAGLIAASATAGCTSCDQPLTVGTLARRAQLSERLALPASCCRDRAKPLQWILHQRVLAARRLLEASSMPFEVELILRTGISCADPP
ncbi:hypothetical protein [Dermatophilus congolensis]|uniref:hypothetical protein n=1 Tax=Dermatophilus congolensis TaxID=1863 RepID=UPI001AAF810B|nr:hypothetical protein [Dermatophilus congolensis]MBO3141114.1 hypothetical protein [Dermatophilus congolensis]MBO3144846.1 hypothetical protein [Dermatophilus congolensis]MBO3147819.1 hypothetical protein [Dermatophilus congolensis]MBO3150099.1 hypothetical protein [Dermatophilus congolensis]MBO3153838.1 hypothetical protein [Dermatophilus congolensis]